MKGHAAHRHLPPIRSLPTGSTLRPSRLCHIFAEFPASALSMIFMGIVPAVEMDLSDEHAPLVVRSPAAVDECLLLLRTLVIERRPARAGCV